MMFCLTSVMGIQNPTVGIGSLGLPWFMQNKKDNEAIESLPFSFQSLREEVMQLTRSLRRAETETKVLQETLAGQMDPSCQPMDTSWIQEKVWLSQEVMYLTKEVGSWWEL